jgi:glycosyltransferase involved in cell wall biosynthesis
VTIVVCTRDRPRLLAGALESFRLLDPPPGEVLVVDNAPSSSATRDVVHAAGVRYVMEATPGLDHARNCGWREASGSVVSYVDDDARVHPRFAAAVAGGFLGERVGGVTGLVVAAELATRAQRRFEDFGGMYKGFRRIVYQRDARPFGLRPFVAGVGTNMAFRRDVLERLGGFDTRLDVGTRTRGGGDLDMLYRVVDAGYAIVYEPSAVVRHIHRPDMRGLTAQFCDNGVAYSAFLAKYEQQPATAAAARRERRRWHVQGHARRVARALRRGQPRLAYLLVREAMASRHGRAALNAETLAAARSGPAR